MAERPQLDLGNYLPYLINRVGFALVESFTADALAPNGLSIAMWRVLAALSNNGEQRQIDLVDMTSIDASTMSRLVTRLVRMGLVTRARSKTSSREVVIALSPKGGALVAALDPDRQGTGTDRERGPSGQGYGGGQARAAPDVRQSRSRSLTPAEIPDREICRMTAEWERRCG